MLTFIGLSAGTISAPCPALTLSDGTKPICTSFTGANVAEIIVPQGLPGYTAYTSISGDGRGVISWSGPRLAGLSPAVRDFYFFHECAHAHLPTSDEVLANCVGLREMRRAGRSSPAIERTLAAHFRNLGYMGPGYGWGDSYWSETLACAAAPAPFQVLSPNPVSQGR